MKALDTELAYRTPGVLLMMVLYREAVPERGTFLGFQVYERVGISLVEVYEKEAKICHFSLLYFYYFYYITSQSLYSITRRIRISRLTTTPGSTSLEGLKALTDVFCGLEKVTKTSWFCDLFIDILKTIHFQQLKGLQL